MNFIEIITKLFGNKAQKDLRAIQPYVDKVKGRRRMRVSTSSPTTSCALVRMR